MACHQPVFPSSSCSCLHACLSHSPARTPPAQQRSLLDYHGVPYAAVAPCACTRRSLPTADGTLGPCLLPKNFSPKAKFLAIWPFGSKRARKLSARVQARQRTAAYKRRAVPVETLNPHSPPPHLRLSHLSPHASLPSRPPPPPEKTHAASP